MKILGITDGQTSGAVILDCGRVLAAINEERIVRLKQARGFPRSSIRAVLEMSNLKPEEIDGVAIAGLDQHFQNEVTEWDGWFEERAKLKEPKNYFFRLASSFGFFVPYIPPLRTLYYKIRAPIYANRREKIRHIIKDEFGIEAPIKFYHHHKCHAASAYYPSGFQDALVVTMDGGGDTHSSHIYTGIKGKLELVKEVSSYDSLGNYYAYITAICGYKSKRHEGKITGLAAYGKPEYLTTLSKFIDFDADQTRNKGKVLFNKALAKLRASFPPDFKKQDLASSIQLLSEDICRKYIGYWHEKTGLKNIVMAGGIFANVKINQRIHEIPTVERLLIHPGMSDEGLAVGAAYCMAADDDRDFDYSKFNTPLTDVYFGYEYSNDEIKEAIDRSSFEAKYHENIEAEVAALLKEGFVVARFNGRLEYGPRALGNRSILYQPTDPTVNDWLNEDLKRTEFMPFAPATLMEHAGDNYLNLKGAEDPARFMTITFDCTDSMRKTCPGVVHIDGTARPQLVVKEQNPSFYRIIEEYMKLTGIPSIINTSFNIHEEPIVCTPSDAIRAFEIGHLDYLAIGNFLIRNPNLTRRGGKS